jgi:hypothetical protein
VNGIYYNANEISSDTKEKLASIGNGSGTNHQELAEIVHDSSHTKILAMLESAQEGIECTNVKVGIADYSSSARIPPLTIHSHRCIYRWS